jgi:hypothetical protein
MFSSFSFMPRLIIVKSLLVSLTLVQITKAETIGATNSPTIPSSNSPATLQLIPTPEVIREVELLVMRGSYDEAIKQAAPYLQTPQKSNPHLLYLRGRAAQSIGAFDKASQDFSLLGDFTPSRRWPTASTYLRKIQELKVLAPANVREVKNGNQLLFRVYYDKESPWLEAVIKLLPQAYAINFNLVNKDLLETPVFVFSNFERFKKFYALNANGIEPSSWVWAAGKSNGIYLCEEHPLNTPSQDINSIYFQIAAAHEFNHCVVGRIIGGASLPNWFSEGLAMMTSPEINRAVGTSYDTRVRKVRKANAILSLRDISRRESFRESVESQNGSDAYAQGYSMTFYLLSILTPEKLTPFLEEIRDTRRFDVALYKFTGLTQEAFYNAWLAELNR